MSQGEPVIDAALAAQRLGVDPSSGPDGLRAAFRASVKRVHPDRPGGDAAQLRAVIEAYDYLRALPPPVAGAPSQPPPRMLEITPSEALFGARRAVTTVDGRVGHARLPPGLRAGDQVRLDGHVLRVTIASDDRLAVIGDHLCLSLQVDASLFQQGGSVRVATPLGPRLVRITRQDAVRGLARIRGEGLPARGKRPAGDLLLRLKEAEAPESFETPAQIKLRRFTADWAA